MYPVVNMSDLIAVIQHFIAVNSNHVENVHNKIKSSTECLHTCHLQSKKNPIFLERHNGEGVHSISTLKCIYRKGLKIITQSL